MNYGIEVIECYKIHYSSSGDSGTLSFSKGNARSTEMIGHTHSFYHYIYVLEASGVDVTIDVGREPMRENTLYMVKRNVLHGMIPAKKYSARLLEIKFQPTDPELIRLLESLPNVMSDDNGELFSIASTMVEEYANKTYGCDMLYVKTLELLFRLKRLAAATVSEEGVKISLYLRNEKNFLPVLNYITEHSGAHISVDTLSGIMHMEKGYFIKQFKKSIGVTPMRYILSVRMNRALNLIEYTDLSISKISEEVGFSSPNAFIKAFKTQYGRTPCEYRNYIKEKLRNKYSL